MKIEKAVVFDGTFNEMNDCIGRYIEMGFTLIAKSCIPSLYKEISVITDIAILVKEVEE